MKELVPPLVVCGLLMPLEAALLPHLGLPLGSGARAELPLLAVLLLAVESASALQGAVGCFLFGVLADVCYQVQPGLFTLSSLLLFVLLRLTPVEREVRGPLSFAVLAAVGVPLQAGLVFGLLWLVGHPLPESPVWSVALGALCTAAVAPLFYWLTLVGGKWLVRDDPSLLR
jgi:hypothetical protein